jgi:hypothetical protein
MLTELTDLLDFAREGMGYSLIFPSFYFGPATGSMALRGGILFILIVLIFPDLRFAPAA